MTKLTGKKPTKLCIDKVENGNTEIEALLPEMFNYNLKSLKKEVSSYGYFWGGETELKILHSV